MLNKAEYSKQLASDIGGFTYDPLNYVLYVFPWGENSLEDSLGPEKWQEDVLDYVGSQLRKGNKVVRVAISSGHGIGKSALAAFFIKWSVDTCVDTRGVITANTEVQLKGKTWPELAKWHRISLTKDWFNLTATALISTAAGHINTWRIDQVPWSERNTEAFAGLHNKGKRVVLIFDESSAIPNAIWETAEGALTDENTEIIWLTFGNPTRNTGRFFECFNLLRHRWHTKQIDSRSVSITNKEQIQQWVDDYGEDSDFVKVRVRGVFPSVGDAQLIGSDLVNAAIERGKALKEDAIAHAPVVIGVDVARFGSDNSVILIRQGLAVLEIKSFNGLDLMSFSNHVANTIKEYGSKVNGVFIDQTGIGAGVVDRLRQLGFQATGVDFGGAPTDKKQYANKRIEMWVAVKEWLQTGCLPDDQELKNDLTGPEYGFKGDGSTLVLEKKEDMKKRGLASPDKGDALALTFAMPVAPLEIYHSLPTKAVSRLTVMGREY